MTRLFRLGLRNVLRNKGRSAITASALLIGVAVMIFGQGILNGLIKGVVEDTVLTRIGAIQLYRAGYLDAEQDLLTFDLPDDPAFVARLRVVPGVRAVSGRISFEGMMGNGSISAGFVATAIDPRSEYEVCPRRRRLVAEGSSPLVPGDPTGILIGKALADGLSASRGSTLYASATSQSGTPNALDVSIRGMLAESGGYFENKAGVVMPLALAQDLLRMPGRVLEYVLHVEDLERVDEVAQALRSALGNGYEVKTWRDRPQIRNFVQSMGVVMAFVAALLAILVVSVIVNTMLMSIYERVREIGTMMAIGVRRLEVMLIFLIESAVLGGLGAAGGAMLGLGFIRLASGGMHVPSTAIAGELTIYPQIGIRYVLAALVVAMCVAVLAALYPAWKASRMKPVDALRAN